MLQLIFDSSVILKLHFSSVKNTVTFYAEISGVSVVSIRMGHDWLLPIREFVSLDGPIDLFHIPSRAIVHLPMHVSWYFFSADTWRFSGINKNINRRKYEVYLTLTA